MNIKSLLPRPSRIEPSVTLTVLRQPMWYTIDKLLNKDQTVVSKNANKDSDVFNTQLGI